jgi:hypothetical protein
MFFLVLPQSLPYSSHGRAGSDLITLPACRPTAKSPLCARPVYPDSAWRRPSFVRHRSLADAAAASLWLTPWTIRERYRVENLLIGNGLTSDVQPRVLKNVFPTLFFMYRTSPPA